MDKTLRSSVTITPKGISVGNALSKHSPTHLLASDPAAVIMSQNGDAMHKRQGFAQIRKWLEGQKPKASSMKNASPFQRNLELALDQRRVDNNLMTLHTFEQEVDFSSNDFLSLATSGLLRDAFLEEIKKNPNFPVGSTASRVSDGNNAYMESLEKKIADFHGAEGALLVGSGYDANCAIFSAVPRPGDAIVYDELIHASVHDGMKSSLALTQIPFKHNSAENLRDVLVELKESQSLIRDGSRCVLVAVESVYSMDGDVTPLIDIVEVIKELFPAGNAQIIIDEAHSTGLIGDKGRGLVCELGLEKAIAIRLHTYGKGLGATGAAILGSSSVLETLINFARPIIFTTAPSFPMVAAIRAGYELMESGRTQQLQDRVQKLVQMFCDIIREDETWQDAVDEGICSIPLSENAESRPFVTQFLPVWTRQGQNYFLVMHLLRDGFNATPIDPPVVPRGTGRVRIIIHAGNTDEQVQALAASVISWAGEMLDLQDGETGGKKVPSAMREVYKMAQAANVNELDTSKIAVNSYETERNLGTAKEYPVMAYSNNAVAGLEGRIDQLEKSMFDIQATLARLDSKMSDTSLFTSAMWTVPDHMAMDLSTHTSASPSSTPSSQSRGTSLRPGQSRLLIRADGSQQYAGPTSLDSLINNFTHSIVVPLCQSSNQHSIRKNELIIAKDKLLQIVREPEFIPSVSSSSPPSTPPLGILQPMIDPYFDNINPHMPIWSKARFQEFIADMQMASTDQPYATHAICLNSLAILLLTAKIASASVHSGSSWSSIDMELVKYFLANSTWAIHNLQELMMQHLSNIQALLSLYLVAQIHWGSERASLFLALAATGAKPLGLYQLDLSQGSTTEEIQERQSVFLCLYILGTSRCWIDGQPPQVPLRHPEAWFAHTGNTAIDPGLLARAKLSHIEETIFLKLYSDISGDLCNNRLEQMVSNLTQMLDMFTAEYRLDDVQTHQDIRFSKAELRIVVSALEVLLYWRINIEVEVVNAASKCLSLFIDLWAQNTGLGNHLTVMRLLTSYASVSVIHLCSFITTNQGAQSTDSAIELMKSFAAILRSVSRILEANAAIKKLLKTVEIALSLCSNRSSPGAWPASLHTDSMISDQASLLPLMQPIAQGLGSGSAASTISTTCTTPYSYGFNGSSTSLAYPATNLNFNFADLDLQHWALELQDDEN
ncbi:pyridoxal phosphate-dependent transferase major domain protein [Fusarium beomiforme]|uniref:Pyridoxal phosphate-dependent transferase major domain protein n=1 Tax=Fusarium beomiforme TaxID=44412 RepID=A0A9P5AE12_9HYPO|nr:pyridoxal phosphate-dependent transferase major domain protein [Fusarium beomiforme]